MQFALERGAKCWNGGEFYGGEDNNSLTLLNHYFTLNPKDAEEIVLNIKGGVCSLPHHMSFYTRLRLLSSSICKPTSRMAQKVECPSLKLALCAVCGGTNVDCQSEKRGQVL